MLTLAIVAGCAAQPTADERSGADVPAPTSPAPDASRPEPAEPADPGNGVVTPPPAGGALPPGATHTIGAILAAPGYGEPVVVAGEIVSVIAGDDFILSDGTGQIFGDGDSDFGPIAVGDRLLVTGTVYIEDAPSRVEIQVTGVQRR
jgi:uncharacterized protein YdeI (BOF family)